MNTELISQMIDSGALRDRASGELELGGEFRRTLSQIKREIREPDHPPDRANEPPDRILSALHAEGGNLYARFLALADMVDATSEQLLVSAIALNWFILPEAELTGVPRSFTPIPVDQIPSLVRCYPESILYAWRDDCNPCDIVRSDFYALFAGGTPDDIGLFAIYGPHYGGKLRDEYDLLGAPTVAFFDEGRLVTRLQGAKQRSVLKAEVSRIRQT